MFTRNKTSILKFGYIYVLIRFIIIIIGSAAHDWPWPPQCYNQAVCITAITKTVQVHTKIYTPYVGSHFTLMIFTPSCCFSVLRIIVSSEAVRCSAGRYVSRCRKLLANCTVGMIALTEAQHSVRPVLLATWFASMRKRTIFASRERISCRLLAF